MNNLALLYLETGNYKQAEPLFQQAREITHKTFGDAHPVLATTLNNLAGLYRRIGDIKQAEVLYQQVLEIRRTALGTAHPKVAEGLDNLAITYYKMGNYEKANLYLQQAFQIWRAALGDSHVELAINLVHQSVICEALDEYEQAEALLRQALKLLHAALGDAHPDVAVCLQNLAVLSYCSGKYEQAEALLQQALKVLHAALGDAHPDVSRVLCNIALVRAASGQEHEAFAYLQQSVAIDDQMIGQVFSIGSESQRIVYLTTLQAVFGVFLSLTLHALPHLPSAVQACLDLVLRRKAIGIEALAAQRDAVLEGHYPDLLAPLRELNSLRMLIAQKTLAGPHSGTLSEYQQILAEWNAQRERLEAKLANQIPEMNLELKLRSVDLQGVAEALPEGSALIEFVRFEVFDFHAVGGQINKRWKSMRYVAFILPAGRPNEVRLIDLGESNLIDRMINDFRTSITSQTDCRGARHLMPDQIVTQLTTNRIDGSALRARVFDPVVIALGDCRRLFLAPDGDLTRLPFELLPTNSGGHLIDEYQISYLGTGRDVLRFGTLSTRQVGTALIAADPAFDLDSSGESTQVKAVKRSGKLSRDLDRSTLHFAHLPGTRLEGERIASMLGVQPLLGTAVLEGHLKACLSPRILHIATHGFFLADQQSDPNVTPFAVEMIGTTTEGKMNWISSLENPLLRSGLALAGANTWLRGGIPPLEAEDGILSAEDVSGLDLLGTGLVVLSACETGLGEVHTGEGVFGLRRAFVVAGARALVMSLWRVPDQQTQELMEDFWHRTLAGQPCADALRQAQLAMKMKYPNPYCWGAFIFQGDPRALSE